MTARDRIINEQSRRALRRRGQQLCMVLVGAATTLVLAGAATLLARLALPWQAHLGVIVIVAVATPLAVTYAVLRAYGLARRDVHYVVKQVAREGYVEATALSQSRAVSPVVSPPDDTDTDETASDTATEIETENTGQSAEEMDVPPDESHPDHEPTTPPHPTES